MRRRTARDPSPSLARPLRALLGMLALLAALALPAHAQDQPGGGELPPADQHIRIEYGNGRQPQMISWSSLRGTPVIERNQEMPDGGNKVISALGLVDVLRKAQIRVESISSIGLTNNRGEAMVISRLHLTSRAFAPPVVFMSQSGMLALLRPGNNAVETEIAYAENGVLTLRIGSEPTLTAHPATVEVGQQVTLTATLPLDVDPGSVEFVWDFNDDRATVRNRDNEMTRTFSKAGTYNVIVNYLVDGEPYGEDAFVAPSTSVTVLGKRRPSRDRSARNASKRGGRDRAGGGAGDGDDDLLSEEGSGIGTDGGDGTGGAGGATTGGWSPPATPATPPPPAPRAERRSPPRRAPAPEPVGETVDGYLLAAANVPLPTGGAVRAAAATPDLLDDDRDGPLEIPALVWVLVGVLGLGLLGWTLESRTTLPYFKP
ncbi:PKD domain-containing protein [Conexibacter arvalis]|uniref:PKD domain-containing protein n=1 Tax=Conexibacter arvalis TaxID=912552 RepID=A0A840IKS1_9ACTN|nr:PKD domain-containing protein [Conexibacter arvalis]MBB4664538.1 hypothetical protein [Conexibacter arvalis]